MQFQTSSFFDMIMTAVVVVFIKGALLLLTNRYSSSTKKVEEVRKIRKCATLHEVSRPLGVEYLNIAGKEDLLHLCFHLYYCNIFENDNWLDTIISRVIYSLPQFWDS